MKREAAQARNMPNRVTQHRQNGRPFDQAFYIATKANQREQLEATGVCGLQASGAKTPHPTPPTLSIAFIQRSEIVIWNSARVAFSICK